MIAFKERHSAVPVRQTLLPGFRVRSRFETVLLYGNGGEARTRSEPNVKRPKRVPAGQAAPAEPANAVGLA